MILNVMPLMSLHSEKWRSAASSRETNAEVHVHEAGTKPYQVVRFNRNLPNFFLSDLTDPKRAFSMHYFFETIASRVELEQAGKWIWKKCEWIKTMIRKGELWIRQQQKFNASQQSKCNLTRCLEGSLP